MSSVKECLGVAVGSNCLTCTYEEYAIRSECKYVRSAYYVSKSIDHV